MEPLFMLGMIVWLVAAIRSDKRPDFTDRKREPGRAWGSIEVVKKAPGNSNISKTGNGSSSIRPMPIWAENGWIFSPRGYVGKYKTPHGSWDGRAYYDQGQGELRFIIYNPPQAALHGGHSACFRKTEEPAAYWVHLNTPPADVFAGIQGIQKTLIESFKGR